LEVPREGVDSIQGSTSVTETHHTGARKRERKRERKKVSGKEGGREKENPIDVHVIINAKLQKGANNDHI